MKESGNPLEHLVIVDRLYDVGNLIIRDPFNATSYTMTREDFLNYWPSKAIFGVG